MARPAKRFTEDEAREILRFLSKKIIDTDMMKNMVFFGREDLTWEQKYAMHDDAKTRYIAVDRAPASEQPELLRAWLNENMKPEAWKRIQASMRQRKVSHGTGSRDTLVLMSGGASIHLDILAAEAGLTKKEFAAEIGQFLMYSAAGKAAFAHFKDFCTVAAYEREKEARRSALPNSFVVQAGKVRPAKKKA